MRTLAWTILLLGISLISGCALFNDPAMEPSESNPQPWNTVAPWEGRGGSPAVGY